MATTLDFMEYVYEQVQGIGAIRYRKMFGDYMLYLNDKPALLICDNTVYVKKLLCNEAFMKDADVGFPYDGAKEHYILDIDQGEKCKQLLVLMEPYLSLPKKKKRSIKVQD